MGLVLWSEEKEKEKGDMVSSDINTWHRGNSKPFNPNVFPCNISRWYDRLCFIKLRK